jgi:hypothetical protein
VDTHADDVTLDARLREVELRGHVRVESPPFHLTSDALRLRRTSRGVEIDAKGKLSFCPCLGTPLAISFDGAIVAPPGDLVLREPKLLVYQVPIFWLPIFWLRSPARLGLLPPDVAFRGPDGLYLGGGVHAPWRWGDGSSGLDVRAGAYLKGGVAVSGELKTPVSVTSARFDRLGSTGLAVDARGALEDGVHRAGLAWDVDVLRGARGVFSTTELDAAARAHDRGAAEAWVRDGGFTLATGVRSTSVRGGDVLALGASGPVATVRRGEAIGGIGDYDVAVTGGALRSDRTSTSDEIVSPSTLSYARAELGATVAGRVGPTVAVATARGAGDVASDGREHGRDGVVSLRTEASLPLVRGFVSSDPADPWRHRIEPKVGASALAAHGDALLGVRPGRGLAMASGTAWTTEAGASTAIGRWGRGDGAELHVASGAVATDVHPEVAIRWRAAAAWRALGLGAEGGHVIRASKRGSGVEGSGNAIVTHARVGAADGFHIGGVIAGQSGVDPVLARLLTDAPLEPSGGFFAADGWTGGARVAVPFSRTVRTRAGADMDLGARVLVAAKGSVELRDSCECVAVRVTAAHRLGRALPGSLAAAGVDVWLTIDLAPGNR